MLKNERVFVAGSQGMVGSALCRALKGKVGKLITSTRKDCDLRNKDQVMEFLRREKPDRIILAAAKVGGIAANNDSKETFLLDNMEIQNSVISSAFELEISNLLFLGSSCIYPKQCTIPITEDQLLSGPLEPTNEGYALAKITGLKLCQYLREQYGINYISAMPCNLYGQGDNYHGYKSHVIPALLKRFHEARVNGDMEVTCWGTGFPRREFLYVDDLADACVTLCEQEKPEHPVYNIGSGNNVKINNLVNMVADTVSYRGMIEWDPTKPDGTFDKMMDSSRIRALGWSPKHRLDAGLAKAYKYYMETIT